MQSSGEARGARCEENVIDEVEHVELGGEVWHLLHPVQHHVGQPSGFPSTSQEPA